MSLKLALGAIAIASAAAPAFAGSFEDFKTLCVASSGDGKAGLAAADAQGWMPVPEALLGQVRAGKDFQVTGARMKSDASGLRLVVVGAGEIDIKAKPLHVSLCAIAVLPADSAFADQVVGWAGVPVNPEMSKGQAGQGYVFVDTPTGHRAIKGEDEAFAHLTTHDLRVVFVQSTAESTMLGFAVPQMSSN